MSHFYIFIIGHSVHKCSVILSDPMFSLPVVSFHNVQLQVTLQTHKNPNGQQSYELGTIGFVQVFQEESSKQII